MKNGKNSKRSLWLCALALAFVAVWGGILALLVVPSRADTMDITGHGLANDPYVIYTPAHWGRVVQHQWATGAVDDETIYVKLGGDIIAQNGSFGTGTGYYGGALYVPANKKIHLDLGQYKIDRNLTSPVEYGSVIISEGYLTIDGDAQLHETADADWNSDYMNPYGVTVTGGRIMGGCNKTTGFGCGVSVRKGTTIMNGGAICNNSNNANAGFEATGVGVNVGTAENYPTTKVADFVLNDGIIALNRGDGGSNDGGGIGVSGDGHLAMYGGDVCWNRTNVLYDERGAWGGGISTRGDSAIQGGKIRHNVSTGRGGGLAPHAASLAIANVEITDNIGTREAALYMGGAVLSLDNVTITGNKSRLSGSNAINISPWGNTTAGQQKLQLSGKIILQNNFNLADNKKISFYLENGKVIYVTDKITDDSDIYLEMATPGTFTSGFAKNSPGTDPGVFSSNLTGYIVAPTANGQELEIRTSSGNADDWNAVVKRSMNEHSATDFTLTKGWTPSASSDGSLGSGRGFGAESYATASTGYDNLRVPEGANVNLTIPAGQVLSRNLTAAKDNGYLMKVYGRLRINGGGVIQGGNNTGDGGAIYVADGGYLTLQNVNLRNNTASRGGAVYVAAGGTLILDSAVISNNRASIDGGGIYVEKGATVIVQNSTAVMNNQSRNYLDNVFIAADGRLTVYSNVAAQGDNSYIGVTLENGVGALANQTAATDLTRFVPDSDFYTLINDNKVPTVVTKESQTWAYKWNAAVRLSFAQRSSVRFDLLGDWVAENGVFGSGDGFTADGRIRVPANVHILLHLTNNATIDRGLLTAVANGNVIQVDGTLTINGVGTITGGNNTLNGGGINVDGTLNLESGTVSGNHAAQGGGIYAAGNLNLYGGTITNNTADVGSGLYADGAFNLQGGTITANTATTGAGVYVNGTGVNNVKGSIKITGNVDGNNQPSNLVFGAAQTINFAGAVTGDSSIGITPRDDTPVFTSNFTQAQSNPTALFTCDNIEYALLAQNNEVMTVLATDLQVTKPQSITLTYNGGEQVAIADFDYEHLNYTLPTGITQRGKELLVTKVGTYTFSCVPRDGYIWEIIDGVGGGNQAVTVTVTVKPIVAESLIWRVDGEDIDRVEYTGAEHTVNAYIATADGELAVGELLTGDITATMIGDYVVTLDADSTDSIDFNNLNLTFNWHVYKAQATVHFLLNGEEKTITEYTGDGQRVTAYLVTAGGQKVENVAITRETQATSLGHYQAEVASSTLANFTVTNDIVCKWSIVAKKLTLAWSLSLDGGAQLAPDSDNQVVYNGVEQHATVTLVGVAEGERVSALLTDDAATDVGEHTARIVGLTGIHAGNYTYDASALYHWAIVPQGGIVVDVAWAWTQDTYYVGQIITAADLASTVATAAGTTGALAGTVSLLTDNNQLLLTEPNQSVAVKFTPANAAYSPVRTTLTVPAKYVAITFCANDTTGGQVTRQYTYNDAVVYVDEITGDSLLKREYYTHAGWTETPTDAVTNAELDNLPLVQLDGNTRATADATYYAVWCYVTYTIRFHTNNPLQYTTLSDAAGVTQTMTWLTSASEQFTQANHGSITYDDATSCYVYEYNHADWAAKSTGDLWFTGIQWHANTGFKFDYWADANGARCDKITTIQNLDLYAQWTGRDYTVHFVDDEATEIGTKPVTNGTALTDAPNSGTRAGWNFAGWFLNATAAADPDNNGGQRVIIGETLVWTQSDVTLHAGWTRKRVVVELPKTTGLKIAVRARETDPDTNVETEKELTSGDYLYVGTTLTIKVTAAAGYAYTGLTITVLGESETHTAEEEELTYLINDYASDEPRIPLIISGTCAVITYDIVYDKVTNDWHFVDGYQAPWQYDVANTVILPTGDKVLRAGYTFTGWATADGNTLTNTQGQFGTLHLVPQWSADAQTIVLYKGGQAVQTVTAVTGSAYQLPDWSHEAGYDDFTFLGWSEQADLTAPLTGVYTVKAGVNNLYAVWAIKTGTLQLQLSTNNATYNFGETVLTITAQSTPAYTVTQYGLSLSYAFINVTTQSTVTNADGKLTLSQVAESGRYYCELTVTAPGYAAAVIIKSTEQEVVIKGRDLSHATYAPMMNVTYTGDAQTPALPRITLDGVTLIAGTDFSYEYTQNTAVGTAHLVITGQGSFTGTADQEAFVIEPAELSVLVSQYTGVYDGMSHDAIVAQEATSVDGAPAVWEYQAEGGNAYSTIMPTYTNASTYTVYYRVTCANHTLVEGSVKVKIDPYQTAVTWETTIFTYDGKTHQPTATMTDITGTERTLNVNGENPKLAGTYSATANTSDQNYQLTGTTTDFVITPRKITATITANGGQRETETIKYTEAKLNDLVTGDNPQISYTYFNEATQEIVLENDGRPQKAGTYLVTVAIADSNYELTGLTQVYFLIRVADETITNAITVQRDNWVYGDTPSQLVFSALDGADEAQITYFRMVDGERVVIDAESTLNNKLAAGTYVVTIYIPEIKVGENESYGRTEASNECVFNVLPRELGLTWQETEFEYDGNQHAPAIILSNVLADDECTATVSIPAAAGITVGSYLATVGTPSNANYTLPDATTCEYTIRARQIKVTILDQTSAYGAELVALVGETAEGAICGLDNADGSVYTLSKEAGASVGTYQITGTSTNPNYAVTFKNANATRHYGQYTITPQAVKVVWEQAETYQYTGAEQTVRAYLVDQYNGQVIELEVSAYRNAETVASAFKLAGDYRLTARETSRNYTLTEATTTATIEPAPLVIAADDLTVRYGEDFNLTVTMTGFVDDEDASVLQGGRITTEYQLNGDITEQNTYVIHVSDYASENYAITYLDGTLTVEGIYLKVQINDQSSVYGNSILAASYTFLGEAVMNPSQVFAIDKEAGVAVGEYKLTGRILNRNYGVEFVTESGREYGIYTITPRAITVEILDQQSEYAAETVTLDANVAYDAVIGLDNADGSVYTLLKEDGALVGEYQITGTSTNPNYAVTFTSTNPTRAYGVYLITPAANSETVYNGEAQDAIVIKTPTGEAKYLWEFSIDGETYTTTMPSYKKPGTYNVAYRITAENEAYQGSTQILITKATLTVVIGENTVEKGKNAALDVFEVIGLGAGDEKMDVIELVLTEQAYDVATAVVGDQFALGAVLREEYADCYDLVAVETNKLTVVEAKVNVGLIIGIVAAALVIGGGATASAIVMIKKKRVGKGSTTKGKSKSKPQSATTTQTEVVKPSRKTEWF